jgi:multisubunit Na+/H+ antiporter MnhC subunit
MAAPVVGIGYLIASDILSDVSYMLIENPVNTAVPAGGVAAGAQTVGVYDPSMYVGAQVVVGLSGDPLIEVVTITAVVVGVSFSAVFANAHAAGVAISGPTFPVRQPTDPFFTQGEMLVYLATALNDFLTDCPLIIGVATVQVAPSAQTTALPADSLKPVRVATGNYPLRETSQSNLDINDFRWQQQAASQPMAYFRDKTGLQKIGITPRANNTTNLEVVYEQRSPQTIGLADGFIVPDPFMIFVTFRILEFAYSKEGEQRNPGLAKYWQGRYEAGIKISNMFLQAAMDPNLDLGQ